MVKSVARAASIFALKKQKMAAEGAEAYPPAAEEDEDEDLFADADDDETAVKVKTEEPVSASNVKLDNGQREPAAATLPPNDDVGAENESAKGAKKEVTFKQEVEEAKIEPAPFVIDRKPSEAPAPGPVVAAPAPTTVAPTAPASEVTGSIPRKSGAKYGLPEGSKIPASVEEKKLLHGKILDSLKSLPAQLINESLTEVCLQKGRRLSYPYQVVCRSSIFYLQHWFPKFKV